MSAPPGRAATVRRVLTIVFVVLTVVVAVAFVVARRDQVGAAFARLSWAAVLGSAVAGVAAVVTTMLGWRTLIADFGTRLPLGAAGRVFFLGQLGKYLPGSVWPVLAQMELGRDYGVRRSASAAAATLMLVLAAVTGTAVALLLLPLSGSGLLSRYRWVAFAVLPLLALLVPAVQRALVGLAARLLRRRLDLPRASGAGIARAATAMVLSWLLFGLHLQPLVGATCDCAVSWPLVTGVFALAWVAGFLVIVAPAGAGAREGVLVLGLAPVLDPGAALLVALVSRVLLSAADLALAGVGVLAARRRGVPGPPSPTEDPAPGPTAADRP